MTCPVGQQEIRWTNVQYSLHSTSGKLTCLQNVVQACICQAVNILSLITLLSSAAIFRHLIWIFFPSGSSVTYFFLRMIWNTACEREEWLFAEVVPDVRMLLPCWMSARTCCSFVTTSSLRPTTCTCCLPSSNTRSFIFLFNRSNTYTMGKQGFEFLLVLILLMNLLKIPHKKHLIAHLWGQGMRCLLPELCCLSN